MRKQIILVLLFVSVILAGLVAGYYYFIKIKNQPVNESNTQNVKQAITTEEKTYTYSENNQKSNYNIDAKYPELSLMADANAQNKINADIKKDVFAAIDRFKSDIKDESGNFCSNDLSLPSANAPCEFDASYNDLQSIDNRILSLPVNYWQYTRGAHGNGVSLFLNYNLNTGEKIDIKTLFKKDADYLKVISEYSKDYLIKNIATGKDSITDADWIQEGTQPIPDNYNGNIGFNNEGMIIIFQPYQVTAYAYGPQTVVIPYSALKNIIKPDGLLSP